MQSPHPCRAIPTQGLQTLLRLTFQSVQQLSGTKVHSILFAGFPLPFDRRSPFFTPLSVGSRPAVPRQTAQGISLRPGLNSSIPLTLLAQNPSPSKQHQYSLGWEPLFSPQPNANRHQLAHKTTQRSSSHLLHRACTYSGPLAAPSSNAYMPALPQHYYWRQTTYSICT